MDFKTNRIILALMLFAFLPTSAQSFLKKKEKKAYECGYVHKESFFNKLKPMKLISKVTGGLIKAKPKSDLNDVALAVGYASSLIPKSQLDFATKTPGWETCGDGVSVYFLNKTGIGLTDTDGEVKLNGAKLEKAGMGTYFQGFSADKRGTQIIEVTSSNGDKVLVNIEPAKPLEIISVNGVEKGGDIIIDGTKDVVIELKGGDADPDSELFVEMIISAMSLKVQTHLYPSKAVNRIVIPKESFKNFENSPLPIIKKNTLSVTRVKNEMLYNTAAGVIQKTATFSDFVPFLAKGDIAGGSLIGNSFSKDKNTKASGKFKTVEGEYNVNINKGNPYTHPPMDKMKNVGVSSFVVRGNLYKGKTTTSTKTTYGFQTKTITTTKTTIKKWFPKLTDDNWQAFVNNLYDQFKNKLIGMGVNVVSVDDVLKTKAYAGMKPITDTVTATFIEKGAYGTKRLIKTGTIDYLKDIKTTFPADRTNEKIIQELNLDGLIAVTIDLDFDLESEGLNPVVKITAFSPNVTYRMPGKYFEMNFSTKAKSLKEAGKYNSSVGGPEQAIFKIIKGEEFLNAFQLAIEVLKKGEKENSAYHKIWKDRM
ncbi:hypothetical protein [Polaribacter aquimarinus]|uniref:Uncharacterized protein n=1 Tax=Polaribacter aquimarinus TaxID=2100726 RepID=A0A2U2J8F9_9FLAO|nr:hypothetical protein [Polaribacter aquimarinus]PWG04604.1 hypothetical protein DIS07_11710 [Polaribacter aquimarinus]